jgi:hypothetical protein
VCDLLRCRGKELREALPQRGRNKVVFKDSNRSGGCVYKHVGEAGGRSDAGGDGVDNRGFMLYTDYYMSHTLICEVCGHDFKRWDKVCNHTLDTGHNAYNVGEPTHHAPPKTSAVEDTRKYEKAWRQEWR